MVFLKQDSKYSLIVALVYIPVNWFGGKLIYHHPVYYQSDWLNWSRPWVTLGVWVAQAGLQYGINWITATIIQHIQGFDEKTMTFRRDEGVVTRAIVEEEDKQEFIGNNTNKEPVSNNTMC
jgi:hypothetical protein